MDDSLLVGAPGDYVLIGTRPSEHFVPLAPAWPTPISVRERLPEISPELGQEFQVFARRTRDSARRWHYGLFDGVHWICSVTDYTLKDATHWLPLPPEPTDG